MTTQTAPAIHPDSAAQITAWLDRHSIALTDCSTADAERVAAEYHAAIAAEHAEALELNAR
jgi:prephenate dehydratase